MTAILIIDIDGYPDGKGGNRPRELGWIYLLNGEPRRSSSIYFVDSPDMEPIEMSDVWFVAKFMHGLPLNPSRHDFKGTVFFSTELNGVITALCQMASKDAVKNGASLVVMHKGGDEGKRVTAAMPGVATIDLEMIGCPRVDRIARELPKLVELFPLTSKSERHCGHHRKTQQHRRFAITHCPRLEVRLFAEWLRLTFGGKDPLKLVQTKKTESTKEATGKAKETKETKSDQSAKSNAMLRSG